MAAVRQTNCPLSSSPPLHNSIFTPQLLLSQHLSNSTHFSPFITGSTCQVLSAVNGLINGKNGEKTMFRRGEYVLEVKSEWDTKKKGGDKKGHYNRRVSRYNPFLRFLRTMVFVASSMLIVIGFGLLLL